MKKTLFISGLSLLAFAFAFNIAEAATIADKLKGKILLQVESKGEAWYVNPKTGEKTNLGRPAEAFQIMRSAGVGITNADLKKIKVAEANLASSKDTDGDGLSDAIETSLGTNINKTDTDSDGYSDKTEILYGYNATSYGANSTVNWSFAGKQAGKILLQVESKGEAWYVNPDNSKRYYLGRPADAFAVMRSLGLGITNVNLNKIKTNAQSAATNTTTANTNTTSSTNTNTGNTSNVVTDNTAPYISSIYITDNGDEDYIDFGDTITVTFSEAINPASIDGSLYKGSYITGLNYSSNGGVQVSSSGIITIKGIATFDAGSVSKAGTFSVKLALNSTGTVLTITIIGGDDISINSENFNDTDQIGGVIRDANGNYMAGKSDITNPTGTFGGQKGDDDDDSDEFEITSIKVTNNGDVDYIDTGDTIAITFSRAINPDSISEDLEEGAYITGVAYSAIGGVSVSSAGKVTIKSIASFDMGSVDNSGNFTSKLALSSSGRVVTLTLTSGSDIPISDESFSAAAQIGGTIRDGDGNVIVSNSSLEKPTGSFGGDNNDDSPAISSIKVTDNGDEDYIDTNDTIAITFSEAINPDSINSNLEAGSYVSGIAYNSVGGVSVSSAGKVTVNGMSTFDMGSVDNSGNFTVKLALNSSATILTITLTSGSDISISDEDFSSATQIGGTVEDEDGNEMEADSSINEPTGSFGGGSGSGGDGPYISSIFVSNGGDEGFIDTGDSIAITFSEAIDPTSVNSSLETGNYVSNIPYTGVGGVTVSSAGLVTVKGIATFDMGSVNSSANYTVKLTLNSTGKILTAVLTGGDDIEIASESFSNAAQIGGMIEDTGDSEMQSDSSISSPTGTFGGSNDDEGPSVSSIAITDGGNGGYIDVDDRIVITFSEAIDPGSINSDLDEGGNVTGVAYTQNGGVSVSSSGKLTVKGIASFDVGTVADTGNFTVKLALNSSGKILTITITNGSEIEITSANFSATTQISGIVQDANGNEMASATGLDDPTGDF